MKKDWLLIIGVILISLFGLLMIYSSSYVWAEYKFNDPFKYLKKGLEQIEKAKRLEEKILPEDIDYLSIKGLRLEARQKLSQIQPRTIAQASRISGVSPADISVLIIYLKMIGDKNE